MSIRYIVSIIVLVLTSQVWAADFPTGSLKGVGFILEKDKLRITEKDLHVFSLSVTIVKLSDGSYEFTTAATMQKSPSTPLKTDRRVDIYKVVWETPVAGKLINNNVAYREDKTNFTIANKELVLKSWIERNQLWETHTYSLVK